MGFEPMIEFPLYTLSKRAPSTARSACIYYTCLFFFEISGFKFSDDNTTTRLFSFF